MDDIGNLVYIAFLLIYVLSRFLGKKKPAPKKVPKRQAEGETVVEEAREKRPTFEELLREFTEQASDVPVKKKEKPKPASAQHIDDAYARDQYQEAVESAKKLQTIDEQVDLEKPLKTEAPDDPYEIKEEEEGVSGEILESLRNPQDARRAIILKEILDTKF